MPLIERTDDARLLVSNKRQSRVVASESDARRTLHSWGHTDISINKALAELRRGEGDAGATAAQPWRVLRAEPATAETGELAAPAPPAAKRARANRRAAAPAPEPEAPAAAAEPPPKRGRRRAADEATPAPVPQPPAPEAPKARGRRRTATVVASDTAAPAAPAAPAPAARRSRAQPAPADADPRARAVELASQLAGVLRELERETLPFARGPWSDLRAKAEWIASCLRGRKGTEGG